MGYGGSEDCIRNSFHNFLKDRLLEMMTSIKLFRKFVKDCENYSKSAKHSEKPVVSKDSSYKVIEDEI